MSAQQKTVHHQMCNKRDKTGPSLRFCNTRRLCTRPDVVQFVERLTAEGIAFVTRSPNYGEGTVSDAGRGHAEVFWFPNEPGALSRCVHFPPVRRSASRKPSGPVAEQDAQSKLGSSRTSSPCASPNTPELPPDAPKFHKPNARTWLAGAMMRNHATIEFIDGGEQFRWDGQPVEPDILKRRLALESEAAGGPGRTAIADALTLAIEDARVAALDELRASLKYRSGIDDSFIRSFARAVTGRESTVDVAVLKHFIWQVKRKVYDMEVEHHLMPILCGKHQGAGKSVAVRKVLRPIERFKDEPANLAILGDERQAFRFSRSFVLFFDEMAKATKADIESFKSIITQPRASWRALGSNRRRVETNRATFIGTSNYRLSEIIIDPTGTRRFYEMTCSDRIDWTTVNAIDYTKLWASVDENGPAPIAPFLHELWSRQNVDRAEAPAGCAGQALRAGGSATDQPAPQPGPTAQPLVKGPEFDDEEAFLAQFLMAPDPVPQNQPMKKSLKKSA